MTDCFHIRPARTTDAGRCGAILSGFVDETAWMPRLHTRAEDLGFAGDLIDRGWVTVAVDAGGVAGFSARNESVVHALYVARGARGQGCGARLLAQMQGASRQLTLWTFQANSGAQRFYLRHGFEEVERTEGQGNDEGLPDIRYIWQRPQT